MEIYHLTKKRLGPSKIRALLSYDYGINISVGRVSRLMIDMNLPKMSTVKPRFIHPRSITNFDFTNHLNKQFNVPEPNQVWASDITYIRLRSSFVYLCVIMDLFSRKIISWKLSHKMDASLVKETFIKAYLLRKPSSSLIFHSDRGSQYSSFAFRKILDSYGIIQSFSKISHPWDNAVLESFFKYMKKEELHRRSFTSFSDIRLSCFEYIEGFYNPKRPHSANDMLSPNARENLFFKNSHSV